ncbi:DUF4846 domain-containing protein [Bernardetia sp. Wsw4-3y2]|uniref:DUF4846 domain-containing protein n=1 Tax=Bernardetia sp. Wsw4-3y2 TaxID=3127471 RepID=UPI0030D128AC
MKTKNTSLLLFILLIIFGTTSCSFDSTKVKKGYSNEIIEDSKKTDNSISVQENSTEKILSIASTQTTVKNREEIYQIPLPQDYTRKEVSSTSFAYYLRHISLKEPNAPVKLYNGELKNYQQVHYRVLDISVGKRDLQQCADAVMRLRAEYLFKTNQKDKISFNYTSGDAAIYEKWAAGYRPSIKGNKVNWNLKAKVDTSYTNFLKYMDNVFMYAGSASLSKELKPKNIEDIEIGDVFIQGGFPGHAVLVVDVAIHSETNKKIFLVAQSYMPAQDIHILKNFNDDKISPWYEIPKNKSDKIFTPQWTFEQNDLMSFDKK